MKLAPVMLAAALLAGCAHMNGQPAPPKTAEVAVAVRCKPDLGAEPQYPDTDEAISAASNIFDLAKLYRAGRGLRRAWTEKLSAAMSACEGGSDANPKRP